MALGDLAVVEIAGPRGSGRGHAPLAESLDQAGLSVIPLRWFCGPDRDIVVEVECQRYD